MRLTKYKSGPAAAALGLLCWPAGASAQMADLLAELPEPGSYTSYLRIIVVLIAIVPWLKFCEWVDKDTKFVRRMPREMWNGIVLGGGVIGLAAWLLLPWHSTGMFIAGFGVWFLVTIGTCAVYVVLRNGYVDVSARVFTVKHIQESLSALGKKKEERASAVERVKVTGGSGAKMSVPDDPNQMDVFESAQALLFDALWRRATEVELLVSESTAKLTYRVDGVVLPRNDLLEREQAEQALTWIKKAADLDVEEHRRPQQGSLTASIVGTTTPATEVEVKTSATTQYERLSLRIVGEENRLRLSDLGLTEKQETQFREVLAQQSGLILVSGPQSSGITTTLYACLRNHDAFMQNLLTLEYKPLMDLENITQNTYDSTKHEASYARQLQTVLRREPDVVMVSDCADRETAHLAVKAAAEGKRIYMGIQARDSFDALKKLVSLAGDLDLVASALQAVTCQRLFRKLCIACRQAYKPDQARLKKANLAASKVEHLYKVPEGGLTDEKGNPVLCTNCQGSGYFGRVGGFELLVVDDTVRELIRRGQPVRTIQAALRKAGMFNLQEMALQKVFNHDTSMNEMLRVLREEDAGPPPNPRRRVKKGG